DVGCIAVRGNCADDCRAGSYEGDEGRPSWLNRREVVMAVEVPPTTPTREAQDAAAAQRVADRTEERQQKIATLEQSHGIARADDPKRVAARIDRLSHYYPDVRPLDPAAIIEDKDGAMDAAGAVLERVIGTTDFVGVPYLEAGVVASRAVGRVDIRDAAGRVV